MAFLGAVVFGLNYFFGINFDLGPEAYTGLAAVVQAALVFVWPNKVA